MIALALAAVLVATTGTAAPAETASVAPGRVVFVTAARVYLDRGAADGLVRRQTIQLFRGRAAVGRCRIELLADHAAACRGNGQPGDSFVLAPQRRNVAAAPVLARHAPLIDGDTLRERAAALAAAPNPLVEFNGQDAAVRPLPTVRIGASVGLYDGQSGSGRYAYQEIDADLQRLPVGATSLLLDLSFTALRQTTTIDPRFRPDAGAMFYLWQAALWRRDNDERTVVSAGRIWPWHLPGLPLLDGLQVGRRNERQTIEAGVYGGLVPTQLTLTTPLDNWTMGAYGALAQDAGGTGTLGREEARAGIRNLAGVGIVREAEALAQVWSAGASMGAGARVRQAPTVERQPVVELAHGEVSFHPASGLRAWAQVRYVAPPLDNPALLVGELPADQARTQGAVSVSWDASRWLAMAAHASAYGDGRARADQGEAGVELSLPRLLGDAGSAGAGASATEGWLRSRAAYVQIIGRAARLRVIARADGAITQFAEPAPSPLSAEVGGTLALDAALRPWLRLAGRSYLRVPVVLQGLLPPSQMFGVVSRLDLTAVY